MGLPAQRGAGFVGSRAGCGGNVLVLEGSGVVTVGASVIINVHLEHVLALVDMGCRGNESVEVALNPVATVEGVDTNDAELSLRGLSRKLIVDSAIATFTSRSWVVRHTCLLSFNVMPYFVWHCFWGRRIWQVVGQLWAEYDGFGGAGRI